MFLNFLTMLLYFSVQVGGWTHPLVPGASPCLQAENGAIMFPDIYSDTPNSSVGIVLLDDVPADVRSQLLALLDQQTALQTKPLLPPDQRLGTLGKALVKGAELVSQGSGALIILGYSLNNSRKLTN